MSADQQGGRAMARFRTIAARLAAQIDAGAFPPGQRLPSVRTLMQREGISASTAVRVFQTLEESGRVYSRHRSGHFVRPRSTGLPRDTWSNPPSRQFEGVTVAVNRLVVDMLQTSAREGILPFGSAVLEHSLIPQSRLARILGMVARHAAGSSAGYTAPPGLFELRCGIARAMESRGVLCGPDDILITAGDGAGIECALRTVARPGDTIAIEAPTYFGILQAIETAGMKALPIRTDARTGIDLAHLQQAIDADRVACVLLNPTLHNPLGFTMPLAHRQHLASLLSKARIPLIEDDVFHDLQQAQPPVPAIKAFDPEGLVIYGSSFSKVLTPGYRVGWCLPGRYRTPMMEDLLGRNISISSLPQMVLSEFLKKDYYTWHTARLRHSFADYPARLAALVARHFPAGSQVSQPAGGFVFWIELPAPVPMAQLYAEALAEGMSIAPGPVFFASGHCDRAFRLCLGRPWSSAVEQALGRLGKLCGVLVGS